MQTGQAQLHQPGRCSTCEAGDSKLERKTRRKAGSTDPGIHCFTQECELHPSRKTARQCQPGRAPDGIDVQPPWKTNRENVSNRCGQGDANQGESKGRACVAQS